MWENVLRCGGGEERGMGGVKKGKGKWGCEEVRGRCGRVYGVSAEGVEKCVGEGKGEVWGVWRKVRGDVGM